MYRIFYLYIYTYIIYIFNTSREQEKQQQKNNINSLFCLLSLQRSPHLLSATVGLPIWPSPTANLNAIRKTFIFIQPSVDKSKLYSK